MIEDDRLTINIHDEPNIRREHRFLDIIYITERSFYMKYFVKKSTAIMLTLCTIFSVSLPVFANSATSPYKSTIVLRTEEDWAKMRQRDLAEYNTKLANISPTLKKDVITFLNSHDELAAIPYSKNSDVVSNEEFLTQFITTYPEYGDNRIQIADDVALLRANPVVVAVRAFFSSNGYDLALDLFNHSLTENPATASLSLTGNTEGMYGHIRSELSADPFLDKMKTFANKSGTETLSDSLYTFDNGDLYWAIHGFTWTRSRTTKGTASFAIDDIYDFNKWKDIPGIVAGLAGTHDFDIHIEGLVQNGVIK